MSKTTVKMNLTGGADDSGDYWMTFYNENFNFQVPEGTQIFKAALTGTGLKLTELTAENNAVILKSSTGPITLTTTSTDSSNDFSGNSLIGVAAADGKDADGTIYVLNKGGQGVGFYKLASGQKAGVGKAYLVYDESATGARDYFGFGEETAIAPLLQEKQSEPQWYDLQGRRIVQPTKGLYIVNGTKVVVK